MPPYQKDSHPQVAPEPGTHWILEPWCVEVSTVSTVSTECRGGVEGVSRGCRLTPVSTVSTVSRVCRESVEGVEPGLNRNEPTGKADVREVDA